jgi:hypothetical protein
MSGLDPLAALAAQAVANAQAAMDEAILNLGADVAALQAQISVGDVIAATVLPPQGGTDLLSFLGQTVAAQIPPGINPGETLLLQVTSFTNSTVTVQNLGTIDPDNPIPTVDVELTPPPTDGPQTAVLTTQIVPPGATPAQSTVAPAPPATAQPLTPASSTILPPVPTPASATPASAAPAPPANAAPPANVAPPREVFVAASVRPNLAANARALAAQIEDAIANNDVEARIAANRATPPAAPSAPASSASSSQTAARSATPPPASANAAPVPSRFPVAPPIINEAAPAPAQGAPLQGAPPVTPPSVTATPEAALLTRLNVPVTPLTLAAARMIASATQNVTATYARLESLLGKLAPEDAGVLRSMLAFAGRFDLRNTRALPEQIAAFVSDVLDGAETKIVQSVSVWNALAQTELPENVPGQAALPGAPQTAAPPATAAAVSAAAQAAERVAAMDYDVKSAILAMIATSGRGDSPQLAGALREALTATTALQLNVLSAQNTDPRTITIPLPAYFYEGGEPVHLRISRDAPNGKNAMSGDNFHIAFVLDTKSLGTVAIDVKTVGRAVSVDVKTQANLAADRFRSTLGDLRQRLESLHYRISAIGAGIAPPAGANAVEAPASPSDPPQRKSFWDTRA